MKYLQKVPVVLLCTLHCKVLLAGSTRKLWLCSLGKLRKLGGSGSPGQLLQKQQTKMLEKVNINFNFRQFSIVSDNQEKALE